MIDHSTIKNNWTLFEYVSLDLEGTGPQHKEREGIVDIAGVLIRDGQVTGEAYRQLLNPEISIPIPISKIHGIYDKDVVDKPRLSEVREKLEAFLAGRILIAHNATVEKRVLGFRMPSYLPPVILDTLKLSRALYPEHHRHGLDKLIERFNLTVPLSALQDHKRHTAYYDAFAAAHAFVHMMGDRLSGGATLAELIKLCAIESTIPKESTPGSSSHQGDLFQ